MFDYAFHALVQEAPLPLAATLLSTYHWFALAVRQTNQSKKDLMVGRRVMARVPRVTFE